MEEPESLEKEDDYSDVLKAGPVVSMVVSDCKLSSPINMAVLFSLLKVPVIIKNSESKLPPGTVITASYCGVTRGILKNRKKKYFKHSVSIDITCRGSLVNAKISDKGVHLCGITSKEMAQETMGYILNHIKEIQLLLDYANNNQEDRDKNIPSEKVAKFYLRMVSDLVYHTDFCTLLDWVKDIKWVSSINQEQGETLIRVKNSNSKLKSNIGICVDFARKFKELFPQYRIFYDNAIKPGTVTINIPYETKDGFSFHTILLQKSGSFTHSGPYGKENKIGYDKFINAMRQMLPYIVQI
jgi:hypothetical protein